MIKTEITASERNNYVLKDKKDLTILHKIKILEKNRLEDDDKDIVKLIRTQLKNNWRRPLIIYLNKLLKRYKK